MKTQHLPALAALLLSTALLMTGCGEPKQPEEPSKEDVKTSYKNPVSDLKLPDPTVIRDSDGSFYLIASDEGGPGLPIAKSKDLVTWSKVGEVFTAAARPRLDGRTDGGLWAPDIAKIGSKYVLYYAYYSTLGEWQWGIGVATADRPGGPWTDKGKLFLGGEIGVRCSIDPFFYSENGKNYLLWGSYYGIWTIELTADGLDVKDGAEKVRLAGTDGYGIEAAMIHKRDGKYYLFVSEGGTGYTEHYKLGAARADNLLGPYLNKAGQNVVGHGVDMFQQAGNGFISPGHCTRVLTDDHGEDWILYHAFVQNEENKGRRLMLSNLVWSDGWPSVQGGAPAATCEKIPYWK